MGKAVMDFGLLHCHVNTPGGGAEPDWGLAEQHWIRLVRHILGNSAPEPGSTLDTRLHRAEHAAQDFLLALDFNAGHLCLICRRRS